MSRALIWAIETSNNSIGCGKTGHRPKNSKFEIYQHDQQL